MKYVIFDAEGYQRFLGLRFTSKAEAEEYAKVLEKEYGDIHPSEFPCRIEEIDE